MAVPTTPRQHSVATFCIGVLMLGLAYGNPLHNGVLEFKMEVTQAPSEGVKALIVPNNGRVTLVCSYQSYQKMPLSWYSGHNQLEAEDCSGAYASCAKLDLPPRTVDNSGRNYTCRGAELREQSWATVQIFTDTSREETLPRQAFLESSERNPPPPRHPLDLLIMVPVVTLGITVFITLIGIVWKFSCRQKKEFSQVPTYDTTKNPSIPTFYNPISQTPTTPYPPGTKGFFAANIANRGLPCPPKRNSEGSALYEEFEAQQNFYEVPRYYELISTPVNSQEVPAVHSS